MIGAGLVTIDCTMQLKWLEDCIVLAQERSFTRAAEIRHVTHPAFGRRIRALEAWAGTSLVERAGGPVTLTAAGLNFLETANQTSRTLAQSHEELQSLVGRQARTVTLATGRTLARTVVADWLVRLEPLLQGGEFCVRTRGLAETVAMLERNEADFSLVVRNLPIHCGCSHRTNPAACQPISVLRPTGRLCTWEVSPCVGCWAHQR